MKQYLIILCYVALLASPSPAFSQSKQSSSAKVIGSFSFTERITDSQGSSPMKGICKVEVYDNDVVTISGKRGNNDSFKYVFAFKSAYYATSYVGDVIGLCSGANFDGKTIELILRKSDLHVESNYKDSGVDRYFDYYKEGIVTQNDDVNSYDFITLGQHLNSKGILTYIDIDEIASSFEWDEWDEWDDYYAEAPSPFKFRSTCTVEDLLLSPLGMGINVWGKDPVSLKKEIERCTQWEVSAFSEGCGLVIKPTSLTSGDCFVRHCSFACDGQGYFWYKLSGSRGAIMNLAQEMTRYLKNEGFIIRNDTTTAGDVLYEKDAYSQTTHYSVTALRDSGEYEILLIIRHTKSWEAGQL